MTILKLPHARVLIAIFLLALCARAAYFVPEYRAHHSNIEEAIHGDDGYFELSQGILAGHGLSWDSEPPYKPNPLRTPVYPYFIAGILALTHSYWAVLALQVLIGCITPLLAFFIAKRITASNMAAAAVGIVMALEPYHVLFSVIFYTETLFIFLFLSFVLLAMRYFDQPTGRGAALASAVLGVAILTKATVEYVPLVFIAFIVWKYRRAWRTALAHAALAGGVVLLILAPWMYRNYAVFGVVGISAQPAFNLITYLAPSVVALEEGAPIDQEAYFKEHGIDPFAITLATASQYVPHALEVVKAHPIGLIKVGALSVLTFFTHDGVLTVLQYAGYRPESYLGVPAIQLALSDPLGFAQEIAARAASPFGLVLLMRLFAYAVTALFLAGIWLWWRRGPRHIAHVFALLMVAYFLCTTPVNGLGVNARFRMPVEPSILAFAALSVVAISRRFTHTTGAISHEQTVDSDPVL